MPRTSKTLRSSFRSDPVYPSANQEAEERNSSSKLSSKLRLAPRSIHQFKIGPPFGATKSVTPLLLKSDHQKEVYPRIHARIDRGFDEINHEWIGYKRNYISVVACFDFEHCGTKKSIFQEHGFCIEFEGEKRVVKQLALRLAGKYADNKHGEEVKLVQHTTKRDKGPVSEPPIIPAISGNLPSHLLIKQSANLRKQSRLQELKHLYEYTPNAIPVKTADSILRSYDKDKSLVKVAKYDRLQFTSYTPSNLYSSPAKDTNYILGKNCGKFILQVQLLAELQNDNTTIIDPVATYAVIAVANTTPFQIRNRSFSRFDEGVSYNHYDSNINGDNDSKDDSGVSHNNGTERKMKGSPLKRISTNLLSNTSSDNEDQTLILNSSLMLEVQEDKNVMDSSTPKKPTKRNSYESPGVQLKLEKVQGENLELELEFFTEYNHTNSMHFEHHPSTNSSEAETKMESKLEPLEPNYYLSRFPLGSSSSPCSSGTFASGFHKQIFDSDLSQIDTYTIPSSPQESISKGYHYYSSSNNNDNCKNKDNNDNNSNNNNNNNTNDDDDDDDCYNKGYDLNCITPERFSEFCTYY